MISERYFDTFFLGLTAQIKELSLDEVVEYIRNHIHSFIMDESMCFCFIERFANDPETGKNQAATRTLYYLFDKALQLRPFRPGLLKAVAKLTRNQQAQQRLDFIEQSNDPKETYELISGLNLQTDGRDAQQFINQLIQQHPGHVAGAQLALNIDRNYGERPGPWLSRFQCPAPLRRDWDIALFNHYATLSFYDSAMELWPTLSKDMLRETSLNLAAEMFIANGDEKQGLELYKISIGQDPRQTPVKLRIRELENPFQVNPSLVNEKSVNICLYSWNKDEMFGQTLKSLSESDIGNARIDVLLNGCTDNSRTVVEEARTLFPNNEFVIHDLHVNIGAPAARNWLMFHPDVQKSEYIAFLDDDVTIPKDWLSHFLTIAEQDRKIGVVGCKTVHPGQPAMLQYLYRYIAMAGDGLLKMSINAPNNYYDNHIYDVVRETRNVMGCLHLLRTEAINAIPAGFDIRFSPSQVDDIDHDICVCLEGYRVMYTGLVTCIHHQSSGTNVKKQDHDFSRLGSIMGNDIKLFAKHSGRLDRLRKLDNLSLDFGVGIPEL